MEASNSFMSNTGKDREENGDQYIANFKDGATCGFKYFDFKNNKHIAVGIRGKANGKMIIKDGLDGNIVSTIKIDLNSKDYEEFVGDLKIDDGIKPLYFTFKGTGKLDFGYIEF